MDRQSKEELTRFSNAIAALFSVFQKEADEAVYAAYELGLEDLPVEAIEYAVRRALRECKYLPTPAELRELTGSVSLKERAVLAFDVFARALKGSDARPGLGPYKSVDFDDRAINATVHTLGGWVHAYEIPEKEFRTTYRQRFESTYQVYAKNGVSREQGGYLMGISERGNRANGFESKPPYLVHTGLPYLDRVMDRPEAISQGDRPPAAIEAGPRKLNFDHQLRSA